MGVKLVDLPGLFDFVQAKSSVVYDFIGKCDYIWVVGKTIDGTSYLLICTLTYILDKIPVVLSEVARIKSWDNVLFIRTHADYKTTVQLYFLLS